MTEWKDATLGPLCDGGGGIIKTGPFGSQLHQSDYSDQGTPVVMPKDLIGGRVSETSIARVGDEHVERLAQHRLETGDIVYGRRGDIGRCALVTTHEHGWLCGTGCLRIHLGDAEISPHFLFYYLNHPDNIKWIYNQAIGATMPNLNTGILRSVPVRYPVRETQDRIASILSTYDNLIENNTRRIEILEEMARRLYEEWFVRFRFPGHEEAAAEGKLPEGWERLQLEDAASFISRGIAPKYNDDAECRVVNQKCIRDQRLNMALARRQSKNVPDKKRITFGDVLINSTGVGTLGRVAQVYEQLENVTVDSHVTIVRPGDSVDGDFFGLALLAKQPFFEAQGVGSTGQTELSRARVAETEVVLPPLDLQEHFGKIVRPMRMLCVRLLAQNANLRAQRDLLLPKLISGQIDVSQAEEMAKEDAA